MHMVFNIRYIYDSYSTLKRVIRLVHLILHHIWVWVRSNWNWALNWDGDKFLSLFCATVSLFSKSSLVKMHSINRICYAAAFNGKIELMKWILLSTHERQPWIVYMLLLRCDTHFECCRISMNFPLLSFIHCFFCEWSQVECSHLFLTKIGKIEKLEDTNEKNWIECR